ncbi:hypothetical protein ACFRCW_44415 [Streptomyces sp. NPDC056653]|uniref:hypothetical protein n=1 Tax=Streptomyces sp. NPDC056653 TaxID=3345894 RepID=UPI00369B328F
MRWVIARFPFDLTKSGVLESIKGIWPQQVRARRCRGFCRRAWGAGPVPGAARRRVAGQRERN